MKTMIRNWATWQPTSPDELIGRSVIAAYRNLKTQLDYAKDAEGRESTMRAMFCGPPGCGKTTIARLLAHEWVGNDCAAMNAKSWKGRQVSIDLVNKEILSSQSYSLFGKYRSLTINECDQVQPAAQDVMLDWLEDELPGHYVVFGTSNLKATAQEHLDKKGSKAAEYLSPKFASRFEVYEVKAPSKEEAAEGLSRITETPKEICMAIARKAAGDLRQAFKEINKYQAELLV
jgi:replication-associated recombination protein RarA